MSTKTAFLSLAYKILQTIRDGGNFIKIQNYFCLVGFNSIFVLKKCKYWILFYFASQHPLKHKLKKIEFDASPLVIVKKSTPRDICKKSLQHSLLNLTPPVPFFDWMMLKNIMQILSRDKDMPTEEKSISSQSLKWWQTKH